MNTPLYYCLAKTVVNGDITIQGVLNTYSASASALASSDMSFKEASKVAIADSNIAATNAARKTIDEILLQYAYVLSDLNIAEMNNNSFKTTIRELIPIFLKSIATEGPTNVWTLNKNVTVTSDNILIISPGEKLIADVNKYDFINDGIVYLVGNSTNTLKSVPGSCSDTGVVVISYDSQFSYKYQNHNQYVVDSGQTLVISNVNFINNPGASLVINDGGCASLYSGYIQNNLSTGSNPSGYTNNNSGGFIYSDPTGTYTA